MTKLQRQSAGKKSTLKIHLNNRLAYLIGVYLGDGCVMMQPKFRNYSFWLSAIDKDFLENTAVCLEEYFNKKVKIFLNKTGCGWKERGTNPIWTTVVYGKEKCQMLKDLTKDKTIIPEMIYKADDDLKKWFIAGVMDSEGYVGKHHRKDGSYQYLMGIASADIWFEDFLDMMANFGVKIGKPRKEKREKPWHKQVISHKIKTISFLTSGCFFTLNRKNKRLSEYIKTLSPQRLHAEHLEEDDYIVRTSRRLEDLHRNNVDAS